jgi:hypothetical protein
MEKISTPPFWSAALLSTVALAACASDPETIPPFYGLASDAGRSASNGGSTGGSSGGTTASTGGTSTAGSGGTGASSAAGGTGGPGFGGGGTLAGSGGTLGGSGMGGASAGAGGGAGTGPGGRGGAGSGFGGSAGTGGRGGATAGGAGRAAAGSGGSAGGGTSLFAPVGALVQTTCADADCHGGKERPSLLNTNPATLYNTLINTAVRQCGSDRLATANDPANSALLELVQHQCGAFVMPEGCMANPCIDADAIATITAWIQAGAPAP